MHPANLIEPTRLGPNFSNKRQTFLSFCVGEIIKAETLLCTSFHSKTWQIEIELM